MVVLVESGSQADVHMSKMTVTDKENAESLADYVLAVLEEDLFNYFNEEGHEYRDDEKQAKARLHKVSKISFGSNKSGRLPAEPVRASHDASSEANFPKLQNEEIVKASDEQMEQNTSSQFANKFTLTRDMTFVDPLRAELVFRHFYPLKDDYKPPEIPSRAASLESVLKQAAEENTELIKIGPKIKRGSKKTLLPPLPKDYFKEETFWTGSVFKGHYVNRQFQHGRFEYPLMSIYESEFKDGHAHTQKHKGVVTYPRGDKFEGEWVEGRHVSGTITFADDFKYELENWNYLVPPDRRFNIEKDIGVKPAGKTLFNDRFPAPHIPPGRYDTGYGTFNPKTGVVRGYSGEKIRNASYAECKWIMQFCRKVKKCEEIYNPRFDVHRLPGNSVEKFVKQ